MDHDQLIIALAAVVASLGGIVVLMAKTFVASKVAAEAATKTNQATNGVGEGEHRLYDMTARIDKTLVEFAETNRAQHERIIERVDEHIHDHAVKKFK